MVLTTLLAIPEGVEPAPRQEANSPPRIRRRIWTAQVQPTGARRRGDQAARADCRSLPTAAVCQGPRTPTAWVHPRKDRTKDPQRKIVALLSSAGGVAVNAGQVRKG
jgi:hypothetical protein